MGGACTKQPARLCHIDNAKDQKRDPFVVSLESFLYSIYETAPSMNGLFSILKSNEGKKNFIDYAMVHWEKIDFSSIEEYSGTTISQFPYIIDSVMTPDHTSDTNVKNYIEIRRMIFSLFPGFLASESYSRWRAEEINRAVDVFHSTKVPLTTLPEILEYKPIPSPLTSACAFSSITGDFVDVYQEKVGGASRGMKVVPTPKAIEVPSVRSVGRIEQSGDTPSDVLSTMDHLEVPHMLRCESWLFQLMCAMENLPMSFSLATADSSRLGFPLIYVNKYFETCTGYNRCDVIGRTAKFLQRDITGQHPIETNESTEKFSYALRNAYPAAMTIKNYTKSREQYSNFVVIKPIFDEFGKYLYVVSLQCCITSEMTPTRASELSNKFMKTVPSYLTVE